MRKVIIVIGAAALGFAIAYAALEGDWAIMATALGLVSIWAYIMVWRAEKGG